LANIKSAEKRNRQRLKRRDRNVTQLSKMRTFVKRARVAIEGKAGKPEASAEALLTAIKQIDKAASKGVIAKKAASRKISRLTLAANRAASAK
jgi:small subunit ribosomal protein S20